MTDSVNADQAYDKGEAYGKHWFKANSVSRVTITDVNGKAFDPNATYAVITHNANFNGMDSSYVFKAAAEANEKSVSPRPLCGMWCGCTSAKSWEIW